MQRLLQFRLAPWKVWLKPWQGMDRLLLCLVIALVLLGGLLIRSTQLQGGWANWVHHWSTGAVGLAIALFLARCRYYLLLRWHWLTYVITNVLLLLVILIGTSELGAQRWISVGGVHLQPSEFAKVGVIITMAALLHHWRAETLLSIFRTLGVVALPWALVLIQPDLGTSLVFGAISIGMLYWANTNLGWIVLAITPLISVILSNISFTLTLPRLVSYGILGGWAVILSLIAWVSFKSKGRWIALLLALGINGGAGFLGQKAWGLLHDYQRERVILFLQPEKDPLGGGYHLIQSRIAIGSGGFWGQGLNHGQQTTLQFIPEQHTDFIFSALGEQMGFLGSVLILVMFWLICWRLVIIARTAKDDFGSLLCIGILSMIIFQVFVNISMTIGLAPVTGLPLPWLSYGRSALLTNFIALGLAQSVAMHRQIRRS